MCSGHIAFLCFVWVSEQTAIISLHSFNISVLKPRQRMFTARYELGLQKRQIPFRPSRVKYVT
jgi:hypothetical protein